MKITAGVLFYRMSRKDIKVLLVNNGKTWSIPKGSIGDRETAENAARRELLEETRLTAPEELIEIGFVDKKSGERLFCFVGEDRVAPKASKEIRKARFFKLDAARQLIEPYQIALLDIFLGLEEAA